MADRSISVRVIGNVAGYLTSMQAASAVTKEFASTAVASSAKHEKALNTIGSKAVVAGGLITAAFIAAASASAKFDSQMSLVKANIDDKSAPSMKRLSDAALNAGKTTVFSATEAAEAEGELAKAGLTSAQITGGALTASLNLASAGQIGLGDAAEYVSSTMVQFGLKASDAAHIADVLAAGADKSLGGVTDLAEGLKYAGVPASQFGISLDQTVGVLAEFASNGIEGSMAGTALRQMLLSLAAPTSEAAGVMQEYGIQVFNAQGKFVGLNGVAGQLHDKLGGLSKQEQQAALNALFTARSISTANILMRDGAKGVDDWTKAVNDQGFASQQASTKLDNLSGDAKKLANTLQADLIEAGHDVTPFLRDLAQGATDAAKQFGELPAPMRQAIEGFAGVLGGVSLLGGGIAVALPKLQKFKAALADLAPEGSALASVLSALGPASAVAVVGLAAAIPIISTISNSYKEQKQEVKSFSDAILADNGALGSHTRQLAANKLAGDGILDFAKKANIALPTVTDAVLGNKNAMQTLSDATKQSGKSGSYAIGVLNDAKYWHGQLTDAVKKESTEVRHSKEASDAAATSNKKGATAAQQAAEAQKKLNDAAQAFAKAHASDPAYVLANALANVGPEAKDSADQITNLSTALNAFDDLAYGTADAAAQAGDALAALAQNGAKGANISQVLSGNLLTANDATRKLEEGLSGVGGLYAKQQEQVFKDTLATKGNTAALVALNQTHDQQVAALKRTLAQMGITGSEADRLAAKYAGIPKDLTTDVVLSKVADAKSAADAVKKAVNAIPTQHTTVTRAEISAMQRQLDSAKSSIKGVPASKTTELRGEISQLQTAINNAKSEIGTVPSSKTTVMNVVTNYKAFYTGPKPPHRAGGGEVVGPGSETSDDVLIAASNHEFVVNAKQYKKHKALVQAINSGVDGFAAGGEIGHTAKGTRVNLTSEGRSYAGQLNAHVALNSSDQDIKEFTATLIAKIDRNFKPASAQFLTDYMRKAESNAEAKLASEKHGVGERLVDSIKSTFTSSRSVSGIESASKDVISRIDQVFTGSQKSGLVDYTKSVNDRLVSLAKQRDAIAAKLQAANELATSITSSAKDFASLSSLSSTSNANLIVRGEQSKLAAINSFMANIKTLSKRGLSKEYLTQLLSDGPDQGGPIAAALVKASATQLHELNATQRSIDRASSSLGTVAVNVEMGGSIAKNFAAGLKSQEKSIENVMGQVAKSFTKQIGHAFHLKGYATGGRLGGIGTSTSDSNLVAGSIDEYMVKAKSAKSVGYAALDYINQYGRLPAATRAVAAIGAGTGVQTVQIDKAAIDAMTAGVVNGVGQMKAKLTSSGQDLILQLVYDGSKRDARRRPR